MTRTLGRLMSARIPSRRIRRVRANRAVVGSGLVSTMTAIAIGAIVMVSVAASFDSFTRASTTLSDNTGTLTRAASVLEQAVGRLDASLPLGACASDMIPSGTLASINGQVGVPSYSFSTPYQNCDQVTTVGTPFLGAAANGVCYYAYPQLGSGQPQDPPDLYCLYIASNDVLYLTEWRPAGGATYTTCNPQTCFGSASTSSLLPAVGSVPSAPPLGCTSGCPSNWFDLGKELNVSNAFSYSAGGMPWSPSAQIPAGLSVAVKIHAENDDQKNWLGPKIYDLRFVSAPTGGDGINAQAWYSLSG